MTIDETLDCGGSAAALKAVAPPPHSKSSLRVVQLGAIAVIVVVATLHVFELDRFFVPKELVLHLTAAIAGLFAARAIARGAWTRVDLLLVTYLLLSIVAAVFATNPWLAMRAVAISVSSVLIFRVARAFHDSGMARPLLNTLAFAVVLASITSLLQTYGIELLIFSENRAPGGTLGNRNFIAHVAAFGLPLVLLATLRTRTTTAFLAGAIGLVVSTASLVLTRSRAAWLAFAAVLIVFFIAMLFCGPLRRDRKTWRRLAVIVILTGGGVAAALLIPNTLRWRSDNPYLETVTRVVDYEEGSGRGRLVQYEHSLRMALRNPLLGVGPGNWSVEYPDHAARHDPSLSDNDGGTTTNPWPSSDWVAIVAERGFVAAAILVLAFVTIFIAGVRQLAGALTAEDGLLAAALLGTIAGAGVVGLFDAVLLLAVPALLVWAALGALYAPPANAIAGTSRIVVAALIILALLGTARSAMQLTAMQIYATRGDRASLTRAAQIDPGNYRVRLRLARMGKRQQRCEHALAARALFPNAEAARAASRGCQD
ncbi:MAG TPA: O-antigen ligase family protein [Thermoanaerobaculia bacterium]|nr:O-antigen ligase family protein [Thermoanaerobaculia bacterium]